MASSVEREISFCDKTLTNGIAEALYQQKQKAVFCDIIMRICGAEMSVHSAVLAAASPYFSAFLGQDLPRQFSQRSPQIIEIQVDTGGGSDANSTYAEAVTTVVDFMYTGILRIKTATVVQVSELARIMQLETVIQFCEEFCDPSQRQNINSGNTDQQVLEEEEPSSEDASELIQDLEGEGNSVVIPMEKEELNIASSKRVVLGNKTVLLHPALPLGSQKLLKAGKLVSTSTQVTPRLLGIHPPAPRSTKDGKTQTHDKDFPEKARTFFRSTRRKQATPRPIPVNASEMSENTNNSEIVMEITRKKLRPTLVRVIKQEPLPGPNGDGAYSQDAVEHEVKSERISDPQEADNEELFELLSDSSCRRSGRRTKPTPKIIALKRKVHLNNVQELLVELDEVQNVSNVDNSPKSSPRKAHVVPRKEANTENNAEEMEVEETAKSVSKNVNREKENALESVEQDQMAQSVEKVPNLPQITRLSSKKKPSNRMRRGRKALKKFSCSECDFQTNKVGEFTCHKRLHKMESNTCYYCDERYTTKDELNEHFEKHKGPLPYFCPVCDGRYKSRTQLKIHLPKHSADKPFICEVCSASFKWKHALKNHMVVHSNRKDHLCDQCGYATAHKCQLKAHKLIHTGDTFRCPFKDCRFQATKRQNLKYHILTHTREKPHQCEICGQAFSLIKNMRRHMLLHSTHKQHQCHQCHFSTTRFDKLKEHMLKLHGMGSPPEKRVRVADLVQDYTGLVEAAMLEADDEDEDVEISVGAKDEPLEESEGVAPLVAASAAPEELIRVTTAEGVIGDPQTMQFMPGQTIIITQTGQDGEIQSHEVNVPANASLLEPTGQVEQVQSGVQFTEVMIPVSHLSDYVQEFNFVSQ